jgi:hypothetical protein
MPQHGLNESISATEEWYSTYMGMAEDDIDEFLSPLEMEPGDNEAIEEHILEAMKHTTVIGGFCSTCQTMLDNWPDLEIANRELYNTEAHLTERKDRSNPGTSLFSKDANLASRFWIGQHYHVLADLPCYEDVSRLLAGARHGCRFYGFILRRKKYGNRLEQFLKIHRGLQKLGKSSQIYMVVSSVTQNTTRYVHLHFVFSVGPCLVPQIVPILVQLSPFS